jgi:hypothetical protein
MAGGQATDPQSLSFIGRDLDKMGLAAGFAACKAA